MTDGGELGRQVRDRIVQECGRLGLPRELVNYICISPKDAEVLADIVASRQPERILEVGTFIGFSTAFIATVAGVRSNVVSVDPGFPLSIHGDKLAIPDPRRTTEIAQLLTAAMGVDQRIELVSGYYSCVSQPETLAEPIRQGVSVSEIPVVGPVDARFHDFDLVFIDGDHLRSSVASDLNLATQQLTADGAVVLHDIRGGWAEQVHGGIEDFLDGNPGFVFEERATLGLVRRA